MIDDLRHLPQRDAFDIIPDDIKLFLLFAMLFAAWIADRMGWLS